MPKDKPLLNGNTTMILKILAWVLAWGGLLGGGALMISADDAKQLVTIGVMQNTQESMINEIDIHHIKLEAMQKGLNDINTQQQVSLEAQRQMIKSMERIEEKLDEQ